jgi:hypothetical protein
MVVEKNVLRETLNLRDLTCSVLSQRDVIRLLSARKIGRVSCVILT